MAKGDPPVSPWTFYDSSGDYLDRHITATVTFNVGNTLTGGSVTRDPGCVYQRIIIGPLDPDGTPSVTAKVIDVSGLNGTRTFTAAQLAAVNLHTVADIQTAPQITAAP